MTTQTEPKIPSTSTSETTTSPATEPSPSTKTSDPTTSESMNTAGTPTTGTTDSTTMRAVTQHAYGSADTLAISTVPRPTIADDEVLIEVAAAGLDRGVWHLMAGKPYLVRILGYGLRRPKQPVPGMDLAGRVVAVGDQVTRFAVGDEVFGIGTGAYAEFAVAKEAKLAHKPSGLSFQEAAVATISGITALEALTTVGHVEAGQHVLVIGASGGVGSFAVQIAKAHGAQVTGVASTSKLDAVRSIGADHMIDYTNHDVDDGEVRYDLIIDIGGRNPLARLRHALTPTGTLVIVGGEGGGHVTGGFGRQLRAALISPFLAQRLAFFVSSESQEHIEPLRKLLAGGLVRPHIGQSFALDDVPAAIRSMEAGELVGKTVITFGR